MARKPDASSSALTSRPPYSDPMPSSRYGLNIALSPSAMGSVDDMLTPMRLGSRWWCTGPRKCRCQALPAIAVEQHLVVYPGEQIVVLIGTSWEPRKIFYGTSPPLSKKTQGLRTPGHSPPISASNSRSEAIHRSTPWRRMAGGGWRGRVELPGDYPLADGITLPLTGDAQEINNQTGSPTGGGYEPVT